MAKVGFKLGLQSAIDSLLGQGNKAGAAEGSFYLTSDTHRLYIGNSDTSLSPVNEGVTTVEKLSDLPTLTSAEDKLAYTGRFYYVSGTQSKPINILCVYNGKSWIQINSNTDTAISEYTYEIDTSANNNKAIITNTIKSTTSDGSAAGQKEASFTVSGNNGIIITSDGTEMVVSGDTYSISTEDGDDPNTIKINLNSENASDNSSNIILKNGGNVALSQKDDVISIQAENNRNTSAAILVGDDDNKTGFRIQITDDGGKEVTSEAYAPKIKYGAAENDSDKLISDFKDGIATLNIYTKGEIDETLRLLNAMTYKGTVSKTDVNSTVKELPTENVKIGDTYLSSTSYLYNSKNYKTSSLFIARSATGEEESTGFIKVENVVYDVVESTDNVDTQYKLIQATYDQLDETAGIGIVLRDSNGGQKGGLLFKGETPTDGAGISITQSFDSIDEPGVDFPMGVNTLTVKHETVTRTDNTDNTGENIPAKNTQVANNSLTIKAVTDVTTDSTGHVTGITLEDYKVVDSNVTIEQNAFTSSAYELENSTTQVGVISQTVGLVGAGGARGGNLSSSSSFTLSSDSLAITNDDTHDNSATGTVPKQGLHIDMVWGTF